jgi:ABC-type sugar transport system ATPase subunit
MPKLIFDRLHYSTKTWSAEFNLELESERWHVICGPSGAGKSTLVNLAAGLIVPRSGDIRIDGKSITNLPPHQRGISIMGQSDGLFPGVSIQENLLLALHDSSVPKSEKMERIMTLTKSLELDSGILTRLPAQISGGQLSRCNLARALLRPCQWLFLDEPFAAVDRPTRLQILDWLQNWRQESKTSIILIAHDLDDVFTVATDVTVIAQGSIAEHATLTNALSQPKSVISARLLRSGIIISSNGMDFFVSSAHLVTSKADSLKIPEAARDSHVFVSPRATQVGPWMRVIDCFDANDVTLPFDPEFEKVVWFDRRKKIELTK